MRPRTFKASVSALLLFAAITVEAKHGHHHLDNLYKRHQHQRAQDRSTSEAGESGLAVRSPKKDAGDQCRFPDDAGLVAVTPKAKNAGWAMSPDQPCVPDSYCPYACPPGQVSMQWDPSATAYTYPKSMNGGLHCDSNGKIEKPFPDKPYCQDAKAGIGALNKASSPVSFCQTVLPGNEAMLIPTHVDDWAVLAVPGTDYWCGTAAHYYINPPGTGCEKACVWGIKDEPIGNWAPYVAGTNVDKNGQTFIKLGWNPIYLEAETPFRNEMPDWGVKVECDGKGCNGLPCAIDPAKNKVNEMIGSSSNGAGGGAFCVVTVPKGVNANFVVFDGSGGSGHKGGDSGAAKPESASAPAPAPSSSAAPTTSTSAAPSSSSSLSQSSSSASYSSTTDASSSTSASLPAYSPHEFFENSTTTYVAKSASITASKTSPIASATPTGGASTPHLSIASLLTSSLVVIVAIVFSA